MNKHHIHAQIHRHQDTHAQVARALARPVDFLADLLGDPLIFLFLHQHCNISQQLYSMRDPLDRCVYTCIRICMHACVYVCECVFLRVYAFFVFVFVCVCYVCARAYLSTLHVHDTPTHPQVICLIRCATPSRAKVYYVCLCV